MLTWKQNPWENLNRSEEIAQECLQIFQEYNRRKLQASALKLLGEIYLKYTQQNQSGAQAIVTQFLAESLQIYQDLDLQEKAAEVETVNASILISYLNLPTFKPHIANHTNSSLIPSKHSICIY